MNSISACRFVFVAMQRVKPYGRWQFHTTLDVIESDYKKYCVRFREWRRQWYSLSEAKNNPFILQSWARAAISFDQPRQTALHHVLSE